MGDQQIEDIKSMFVLLMSPAFTTTSNDTLSSNKKTERVQTSQPQILLTEVLSATHPRRTLPQFNEARRKEKDRLTAHDTWTLVPSAQIPSDANVLGGRLVLSIKNYESQSPPTHKARFVCQGHRDADKHNPEHTSTTIRQSTVRFVTAIAATFGFKLWSYDVTQAYLQSADKLGRDVYIKPPKDFPPLPSGHVLKLNKPLYGLCDSGDYCHKTLEQPLLKDLGMTQAIGDPSLFMKHEEEALHGLTGTYVDDTLWAGDRTFSNLSERTPQQFESRERESGSFIFAGSHIQTVNGTILLRQKKQAEKLIILPTDATFKLFKSRLMELVWLTNIRPEVNCAVAQLAQITENVFTQDSIQTLNLVIRNIKRDPCRGITHRKLDLNSLYIRVYSECSFANNQESSSQLGYIIILCEKSGSCNVLQFRSFKSKRVVRSVLGAEMYRFADAFDQAFVLRHDLETILNRRIPIMMSTDSKSLFDVITKNSTTTERRLMIDLKAAWEPYKMGEISDIGFIRSAYNAADAFTKIGHCEALETILSDGHVHHPVEQWIVRDATASNTTPNRMST